MKEEDRIFDLQGNDISEEREADIRNIQKMRRMMQERAKGNKPKTRFCLFIKRKRFHSGSYNRFEIVCLAIRIGYWKEALRVACGRPSKYLWEEYEDKPLPY